MEHYGSEQLPIWFGDAFLHFFQFFIRRGQGIEYIHGVLVTGEAFWLNIDNDLGVGVVQHSLALAQEIAGEAREVPVKGVIHR